MRKVMLLLLVVPVLALAQSPFDGTWKFDTSNAKVTGEPNVYVLQNGMFNCKSCAPPYNIKADGTEQSVTGHPYFDKIAIKAVDDKHVHETWSKGGKPQGTQDFVVSADGKSMTVTFTDNSAPTGIPVKGSSVFARRAEGPNGSHAMSGSWDAKSFSGNDEAMLFTIKVSGDTITMSSPLGTGYTAKLDGGDAPYKGDPGVTSVSVKRLGPDKLEETDKRDGKAIYVSTMTVDGSKMNIVTVDKLHPGTTTASANKQ